MLYKTHKKYGILWGVLGLTGAITFGLLPAMNSSMRITDKVFLGFLMYVAMRGAIFGAEFPDIDSPGSIPARHHPFIRKIFAFFHIAHRGKFSHDYASLAVFFGLLLFLWKLARGLLMSNPTTHQYAILGIAIWMVFTLSKDVVDVLLYAFFKGDKDTIQRLNFIAKVAGFGLGMLLAFIIGFVTFGSNPTSILRSANFAFPSVTLWFIFTWVGSYSHLFADMMTKEGVHFFGQRIAPARVVLLVKKIPLIGRFLIPSDLKTGSSYEDFCRMLVVIITVPAVFLLFTVALGGDVQHFFSFFS